MPLKSLLALSLLSGALLIAGWGAISFAGLTTGVAEKRIPFDIGPDERLGSPVTTASIDARQVEPDPPEARDHALNALLFSPHFIAPAPAPAAPNQAADPVQTQAPEATAAVPIPPPAPPRQRSENNAAGSRAATNRPPRDNFRGPFTLAHIARIKARLNLSPDQEEHWRPVEAALRRIAQRQPARGGTVALSATESQDLYWAAGPLIMSLRPDQREAARNLARSMGLETVAALI